MATRLQDLFATAWMVRVLKRAYRDDKELTGATRATVKLIIDGLDSTRELQAIVIHRRRKRRARKTEEQR